MIIVLKQEAKTEDVTRIEKNIEEKGLQVHVSKGENQTIMGLIGDTTKVDPESIEVDPAVEKVMHVSEPYKLANRAFHPEDSVIDVGGVKIGGGHLAVIAGPCSVESKEQVIEIAKAAKAAGANLLRGGAFKPRTSPYAFQGMGSSGLDILVAAKEATGLPIVSELMDAEYLDEFIEKVDLIQIGARNMQNFDLLKKVGKATKKPILLKRGLSATFQEWIMSAEYIMASGNPNVILCERGVRTFESYTRNTLDLQAVPVIKELTHLPIIIDPSHAGGKWWLVNPMAKAAVAAGCDGLMIEVHNNPEKALCDGPQSLKPAKFEQLMKELKKEMNTAVVIKMKQADKKNLSARAGKIIGKRPVYDFSVTGIKKKQSSVLKKGRIRVAVSYNASKKEKDKKIFAYKIDKYSAAVKIPGSYYDSDTKTVNFVSRGFFTVAVGCEK